MIDQEKLMAEALGEMARLKTAVVEPIISMPNVCILVANLQLAIRHPTNPTKDEARRMADLLINAVEELSPSLAEFMRLGYNREHDQ